MPTVMTTGLGALIWGYTDHGKGHTDHRVGSGTRGVHRPQGGVGSTLTMQGAP